MSYLWHLLIKDIFRRHCVGPATSDLLCKKLNEYYQNTGRRRE